MLDIAPNNKAQQLLIAVSTTDGHTNKIAQRIAQHIESHKMTCVVKPIGSITMQDLNTCQQLLIGASVRYGKHQHEVVDFVDAYRHLLDEKKAGLFSVCAVARKAGKDTPQANPYYRKLLKQLHWQPRFQAVFAGRLTFDRYGFFDRTMIRFIMWLTKGPTAKHTDVEFTDWQKVDNFSLSLCS